MVYTDEHGYERWRLLTGDERRGQNRWEELLEYTDAFEFWKKERGAHSKIIESCKYEDIKKYGIYYRVFTHPEFSHSYKQLNLYDMAYIGLRKKGLAAYEGWKKVAFAIEEGLRKSPILQMHYSLVWVDPSIKAEEAMACIALRSLETQVAFEKTVKSPLKRLVQRIENNEVYTPKHANYRAQRCKDEFERLHYTQLIVYITCTDDLAWARLKGRVPAYEIVVVEEYAERRMLKLAVPRLGPEEEAHGQLRWKYDGNRLCEE